MRAYETRTRTYYGEELSDNSDSEEESHFTKISHFFSEVIEQQCHQQIKKAEKHRFEAWLSEGTVEANIEKIHRFLNRKVEPGKSPT